MNLRRKCTACCPQGASSCASHVSLCCLQVQLLSRGNAMADLAAGAWHDLAGAGPTIRRRHLQEVNWTFDHTFVSTLRRCADLCPFESPLICWHWPCAAGSMSSTALYVIKTLKGISEPGSRRNRKDDEVLAIDDADGFSSGVEMSDPGSGRNTKTKGGKRSRGASRPSSTKAGDRVGR